MKIVNKLTLRHLKENKGRTIITTLGICVSVAMITAVFVSLASFMKFYGDATILQHGNKHAEYYALSNEQVSALKADDRIDEIGLSIDLPEEADGFIIDSEAVKTARVGSIYAGDETNLKQMLTSKMDGNMPKNEHEIAVEQSLIEKNKLDWKIGDTVTVQIGERYYESEGEDENGNNTTTKEHLSGSFALPYEEFTPAYQAKFKVVGILHDNSPTYEYGKIVRGLSAEEKKSTVNAAITLKNVNYKALDVIDDISKHIGASRDEMYINKDFLQAQLAIDKDSIIARAIIPMGLVILVIIMIASVVLIYNSFGMSLSERTRYLGMLGSVGATKKQKKQSVYFEGAFLGLIGIPLGIIGGVIGIGVTLEIVGNKIVETGMLTGVENSDLAFKPVVPMWAVIGVVIFSLITIFISAVIPAKKASSITPVEALRQSTEFKLKAKNVKSPKYIRKIFGYEGELAHKNLKRNGRKSRVITASIAISVILFLSVNYFCDMFVRANGDMGEIPYQIQVNCQYDDKDTLKKTILEMDHVDDVYGIESAQLEIGKDCLSNYDNILAADENLTNAYNGLWNSTMQIQILGIDDDMFNKLCEDNGIDYKPYYSVENYNIKMVLLNNLSRETGGSGIFNENAIGGRIIGQTIDEYTEYYYQVQNLVDYKSDNKLFSLVPKGYFIAYVPLSIVHNKDVEMYKKMYKDDNNAETIWIDMCVETENHKSVTDEIVKYCDENGVRAHAYDVAESMETINTVMFVLQVFVYGFITLITMITIANIINTISTSIALRRKEFAMLKSVGATQKGFYKMVCLESLFYGLKALLISVPLSVLISFGLNKMLGENKIPFEIDFAMYACVILAVFLIIGFSMLYSIKKIKKDSIIETLKQDIT